MCRGRRSGGGDEGVGGGTEGKRRGCKSYPVGTGAKMTSNRRRSDVITHRP